MKKQINIIKQINSKNIKELYMKITVFLALTKTELI